MGLAAVPRDASAGPGANPRRRGRRSDRRRDTIPAEDDAMPIHDWTRVPSGLFHDFHQCWTIDIKNAFSRAIDVSDR